MGLRREENQDSFGIIKRDAFHAYLVADGMGGVQGGGVASRLAISSIEESLAKIEEASEAVLTKAIFAANAAIHQKGASDPTLSGMGTTLVGLIFSANKVICVNVGDSRAYRFQRIGPKQLSEDHTLVGELIRSGAISKEQAANHPVSHMLTRSLGPVAEVQVDCKELSEMPEEGDVYLLCSDGLYGLVSEREILAVLRESSLDEASQSLIALANDRGGNDNITLILIAVGDHREGLRAAEPEEPAVEAAPTPGAEVTSVEPAASMLEADTSSTAAVEHSPASSAPTMETSEAEPQISTAEVIAPTEPTSEVPPPVAPEIPPTTAIPMPPPESEPASQAADPVREKIADAKPAETASESRSETKANSVERKVDSPALRMILLVGAALLLGVVVGGRLFGGVSEWPEDAPGRTTVHVLATTAPVLPKEVAAPTVAIEPTATLSNSEPTVEPEPTIESRIDMSDETVDAEERGDSVDVGRLLKTRELFELALSKTESQLSSLDQPMTGEIAGTLSNARRRTSNLNNRLVRIEQEKDANSRKLVQWYTRQKRLETQDPLKLANEIGATSDEVQKKNLALQKATHEYIRKRDELELYPSNETLREEVLKLRDERGKAVRELQDIVKIQVREVLEETHKKIDELTFEYNTVNWELQSAKQELDVVKARTGGDVPGREQMRQILVEKREGLKANIAELTLLINSRASTAVGKLP